MYERNDIQMASLMAVLLNAIKQLAKMMIKDREKKNIEVQASKS